MSISQIVFYFLAVLAVGSAALMITRRNPVHSILWLIVVFFAISGNYILLNAQFLAIVNIIVYAGAIMVLFLFVVMLMNLNADAEPVKNQRLQLAGFIAGGCLMLVLVMALMKAEHQAVELNTGNMGLVKELGKQLFTDYVVPFEISSVLFLSAMIGAVVIGKKEQQTS
jgi:NADH-quinone oxidoreductase subunit J